jgi:hypothetical protein
VMDILISLALSVIVAALAWLCYCLIGGPR